MTESLLGLAVTYSPPRPAERASEQWCCIPSSSDRAPKAVSGFLNKRHTLQAYTICIVTHDYIHMMLDTPLSHWLPLQPLSTAPTAAQDHHHASTSDSRAARPLPGCTCSIEALRETFTPLYYSSTPSTGRTPPSAVAISHASTRDLAELLRLHVSICPAFPSIEWSPASRIPYNIDTRHAY